MLHVIALAPLRPQPRAASLLVSEGAPGALDRSQFVIIMM